MTVCSLGFVLGVFFVASFFFYLPVEWRRWTLTVAGAVFLWLLVPNAASWAALAIFLVSGWLVARALATRPSPLLLSAYLVALVATFMVLKKYAVLRFVLPHWTLEHPVAIVGLSFMLFRQIHYVVDSMQGDGKCPSSLWTYLHYQLNPFTLLSGPIQRFGDFSDWWRDPRPMHEDRRALLKAVLRVLVGILLIAVVSRLCLWMTTRALTSFSLSRPKDYLRVPIIFYAFPAYIYFNFAGYCDIVIGSASLFGMRVPENFNRPFVARNMIDFWTRWHITLTEWIRDYVFTPLLTALVRRRPAGAQGFAMICYFIALFLAGVWHGASLNFVVFGLLNGVGVASAKLWETRILRAGGRAGLRAYLRSPAIRTVATVANFHFVCFTMMFFTPDLALAAISHFLHR